MRKEGDGTHLGGEHSTEEMMVGLDKPVGNVI